MPTNFITVWLRRRRLARIAAINAATVPEMSDEEFDAINTELDAIAATFSPELLADLEALAREPLRKTRGGRDA